ncbi:hypothetical protein [Litorivita sp. NS0012-18]|uniref:hypothetical protein n=1 Tax=Litorivita sp. NS0012-18 TaxID=3127655 RepID=UPI003108E7B7
MQLHKWILAGAAALSLSACGDTFGEQAVLGAGAGAGTAVATGGDITTGAVIGAAANVAYCRKYPSRC